MARKPEKRSVASSSPGRTQLHVYPSRANASTAFGPQFRGARLAPGGVAHVGRLRRVDSGESTRLRLDLLEPSRVDHGPAGHAVGHAALVQGLEPRQLVL